MRFAGEKMGGGFTDFLTDQPDFGMMGENNIQNRFKETAAGIQGEGMVNQYGLKSVTDVIAAGIKGEATKAAGRAAGQDLILGGLKSGVQSAVGGFMKMPGAGGTPSPTPGLSDSITGPVGGNPGLTDAQFTKYGYGDPSLVNWLK